MTFSRTRCPHCKKKLEQGQRIHPECIDGYAEAQAQKKEREERKKQIAAAKVERAETRKRKENLKRIPDLIKEAQIAFNSFIRERDKDKPCICCGKPLRESRVGGGFDCGHYRSTGSASHLRFNETNAHGQRKFCNQYLSGNAVNYRIGLINRIGLQQVEALEADNKPHKWTAGELRAIKDKYKQKLKELQNEHSDD